jgi:hypothetical protein
MGTALSEFCVYTILHSTELERVLAAGGSGKLVEHKAWTEGDRLFGQARATGQLMPIVFSAADEDAGLIFWGAIEDIDVERNEDGSARTTCRYRDLRRIEPSRPKSALTLRSRRRPLSDSFIRPYALCRTPHFLDSPGAP